MKANQNTLRAMSLLLQYPDAERRRLLPLIVDAIDAEAALSATRRAEIRALVSSMLRTDPIEIESRYVELFDRGRSTSLHLFEHVHGDSRDRGPAMLDLIGTYRSAGLDLDAKELPDHLCVLLEFASTQPPTLAREFLGEMAHILKAIFSALRQRESSYATVIAAVLEIAGHKAEAVPFAVDEDIDEAWAEPPVFDGCSSRGQAAPGKEQAIRIVPRSHGRSAPMAARQEA